MISLIGRLAFLPVFFLLFIGCSDSASTVEPNGSVKELFPLSSGNVWKYHLLEYYSNGSLRRDDTSQFQIINEASFQGYPAYQIIPDYDTTKEILLYYRGSSDLYSVVESTFIKHLLHYPMGIGETFVMLDTVYPGGIISKQIIIYRSKETIDVPAGSFESLHFDEINFEGSVDKQDTNSISKQYYAIGIGLVKQDDYAHDANMNQYLKATRDLVSYIVK